MMPQVHAYRDADEVFLNMPRPWRGRIPLTRLLQAKAETNLQKALMESLQIEHDFVHPSHPPADPVSYPPRPLSGSPT
jgi:hypothetical protein